jgi:hypothetical protein
MSFAVADADQSVTDGDLKVLSEMAPWAWLAAAVALIVALFAFLFRLGRRIEPDDRDTDNDEWLRKGGD